MPLHDWQFWATTAAMLGASTPWSAASCCPARAYLACGACAAGAAACSRPPAPAAGQRRSPLRVIRD